MSRKSTVADFTRPTALAARIAQEEGRFIAPRQLTALAKRGTIPSETTADGLVLLRDGPATRQAVRDYVR
jgi:hypothetical protein